MYVSLKRMHFYSSQKMYFFLSVKFGFLFENQTFVIATTTTTATTTVLLLHFSFPFSLSQCLIVCS